MHLDLKSIYRYLVVSFTCTIFLFIFYHFLGFRQFNHWINFRELIIVGVFSFIAQLLQGTKPLFQTRLSIIMLCTWGIVYPIILTFIATKPPTLSQIAIQLRTAIALWLFLSLIPGLFRDTILRRLSAIFSYFLSVIFSVPVLLYGGYVWIYGTPFPILDMVPILHTTFGEVSGYIYDQIGFYSFIIAILFTLIYLGWLGVLSYQDMISTPPKNIRS